MSCSCWRTQVSQERIGCSSSTVTMWIEARGGLRPLFFCLHGRSHLSAKIVGYISVYKFSLGR